MKLIILISLLFSILSCGGEIITDEKQDIVIPKKPTLILSHKVEPIVFISDEDNVIKTSDNKLSKELNRQKLVINKLVSDLKKIKKSDPVKRKVPITQLLKDKKFKHTGHYGHGTKCRGMIYRKDFIKSRTYLHVDCYGNYTIQQVWRK